MKVTYLIAALSFVAAHSDIKTQDLRTRDLRADAEYAPSLQRRGPVRPSSPPGDGKSGNDPQRSRAGSQSKSSLPDARSSSQARSQSGRSPFTFSFPLVRPSKSPSTPASASSNPPQPPRGSERNPTQVASSSHASPSPRGGRPAASVAEGLSARKAIVAELKALAVANPGAEDHFPDGNRRKADAMASIQNAEQERARAAAIRRQNRQTVRPILQRLKTPDQFFRESDRLALLKYRADSGVAATAAESHALGAKAASDHAIQSRMFKEGADQLKKSYRSEARRHVSVQHEGAVRAKTGYEFDKQLLAGNIPFTDGRVDVRQSRNNYKTQVRKLRKIVRTHADVQNAFSGSSSSESEGSGFSDVSE